MLILILNPGHRDYHRRLSESNVRQLFPDAQVFIVSSDYGNKINQIIREDQSSHYVMTLFAGDLLGRRFCEELQTTLLQLNENCGVLLLDDHTTTEPTRLVQYNNNVMPQPVLWRKVVLLDTQGGAGFSTKDQMPFERYLFIERLYRLSADWSIQYLRKKDFVPYPYPSRKRFRLEADWSLVRSILTTPLIPSKISKPTFSIVICCYNDSRFVHWAIRSVRAQELSDWELIIINDGSDDETEEELRVYQDDPQIKVISHKSNLGKAVSLNTALSSVSGQWLIELDADDWLTVDCLTVMKEAIDYVGQSCSLIYAGYHTWLELPSSGELIYQAYPEIPDQIDHNLLLIQAEPIAPRCYRVSVLKQLGGWWTSGPYQGRLYEDIQMLYRISRTGQTKAVHQRLYHRRLRHNSSTQFNKKKYERWRKWFMQL